MTYRQVDLIEVHVGESLVGAVAPDPSTGRYVFAYSRAWVAGGVELSPLHMPLRTEPYELAMWPELTSESYKGLPPLLADSLPDAFGNALVNRWMVEHGVRASEITTLDRLGYVADRAMGALEFRPPARDDHGEPRARSNSLISCSRLVAPCAVSSERAKTSTRPSSS